MNKSAENFVKAHLHGARKFNDIFAHLTWALMVSDSARSLVLEFGVGSARTTNVIASIVHPGKVYGFDCFTGLPEDWRLEYPKGTFSSNGKPPPVMENVTLVNGLFKDTLPGFIKLHDSDIRFIHIDCDLYSSTKEVLTHCAPHLRPGTILVFDEYLGYDGWECHEYKALSESRLSFKYISVNLAHEQVAIQLL